MSSKALRTQLIAAIAMVLVASLALGSSTYAWFTMNKTVEATGLTVQARAEGGIVISRKAYSRDTASDTATSPSTTLKLLPTSTANATTWYHAEASVTNDEAAQAGTMKTLSLNNTDSSGTVFGKKYTGTDGGTNECDYVLYDTYMVYPDKNSASFTDLWVSSCTVASATKNLSKSLRVAIVCGSNVVICAPVSGATTTYTVGTNPDGTTAAGTEVTAIDTSGTGSTLLVKTATGTGKNILVDDGGVTTEGGVLVTVYIYFEGEDENHTTDNLNVTGAAEALTVTVKFSCTSIAASGTGA